MSDALTLLESKRAYLSYVQRQVIRDSDRLLTLRKEYMDISTSIEVDKKSIEVVKFISDRMTQSGFSVLQDTVTNGLQAIFTDDSYSFEMETSERGSSKVVRFYIRDSNGGRTPIDSCGGGIQVMVSFILRVYMIVKLKLKRFIVLDEAFTQVSAQYTEGLMDFLTSLTEDLDFKFLWISHSPQYIASATRVYEMTKGKVRLINT